MSKILALLLFVSTLSVQAIHEIDSPEMGQASLNNAYSHLIQKRFKNISRVLNLAKSNPRLVTKISLGTNSKALEQAELFIKENDIKALPSVKMIRNALIFKAPGITVTTTAKDLLEGNYLVNGKKYHYDKEKIFSENYRVFKKILNSNFSIMNLFIQNAFAEIPSANIYLAVSLVNDYQQKMLFDTDNMDDFVCTDIEMAKEYGMTDRCAKLARLMVENNIINLGKKVRADLKDCNRRLDNQRKDIKFFKRYDPEYGYDLDLASVINKNEKVMSEISYYLQVSKVEKGDQNEISEINSWINMNLDNQYLNDRQRIKDIKSLSCLKLLFTTLTRRESDVEKYEKYINKTCTTVEKIQSCHKKLFNTTASLRNLINNVSRHFNIENKNDYLPLPRVRSIDR